VFIQLDTSSSMNLASDNRWVPGGADNPASRLHMAKAALHEVFESADYHFGFSSFNQDALRVRAKHWLYRPSTPEGWPIGYPTSDDLWTFGQHFDSIGPAEVPPAVATAGSCDEPLDVAEPIERQKLNSFAKLHLDLPASRLAGVALGAGPMHHWLTESETVYRLTVTNDISDPSRRFGAPSLPVRLRLERLDPSTSCAAPAFAVPLFDDESVFSLEGEFLMDESRRRWPAPGCAARNSRTGGAPWGPRGCRRRRAAGSFPPARRRG
jgi:hypothetical protein